MLIFKIILYQIAAVGDLVWRICGKQHGFALWTGEQSYCWRPFLVKIVDLQILIHALMISVYSTQASLILVINMVYNGKYFLERCLSRPIVGSDELCDRAVKVVGSWEFFMSCSISWMASLIDNSRAFGPRKASKVEKPSSRGVSISRCAESYTLQWP